MRELLGATDFDAAWEEACVLALARDADATDFDVAWERAWTIMRKEKWWPHATMERHDWQEVLMDTRPEFRRCWYGEPSPFEKIARMILDVISEDDIHGDDGVVIALALG